jgi:hypothetical protein
VLRHQALEAGDHLFRLRQIELRARQVVVDAGEFGGLAAGFLGGEVGPRLVQFGLRGVDVGL